MKSWWNRNVRDAKAQGAKDGARMIPATEGTVVSQWEERLVNDYEASIRHFEGRFKQADASPKQQFEFIDGEHIRAKDAYDAKYNALKRPILLRFHPLLGKLLVLAVILVELPLNRIVFVGMTGESELMGWLLAFLVSLFLAIVGHIIGVDVRHYGFMRGRWLLQSTLILFAVCVLAGIAYVRVFIFSDPGGAGSAPLLDKYLTENIDVRVLAMLFMILNALLVVIAGWLAHESHDQDEQYQALFRQYRKWARKARKLAARREHKRATYVREASILVENAQELITIYRQENVHAREPAVTPRIWAERRPESLISMNKYNFRLKDEGTHVCDDDEVNGGGR